MQFFLHCSGTKLLPEKTVHFLEETFSVVKPSGDPEPATGNLRPNSSEPSLHNQTWTIKQEVERLMEDNKFTASKHSKAPSACTQVGRQTVYFIFYSSALSEDALQLLQSMKHFFYIIYFLFSYLRYQQVSRRSTVPQPSPSSARRSTVSSVKTRRVEGRTGITPKTSGRSRTATTTRTQPAVPPPGLRSQEKNKEQNQDQDDGGGLILFQPNELHVPLIIEKIPPSVLSSFSDVGITVSSGLVASVQSLVATLQQQIDTSVHQTPADSQKGTSSQDLPTDNVISCSSSLSLKLH